MLSGPGGVASRLRPLLEPLFGGDLPIRIRAWDGSEVGPAGAPTAVIAHRRALRRLLWQPDELGLAQAYVTGELDVDGDLLDAFTRLWSVARERDLHLTRPPARDLAAAAVTALRLGVVGPKPKAPASQAKVTGRLHSLVRDRAAIRHHYDLSNAFYALLLDDHLAYSSAYWVDPDGTLEQAQEEKLALVCRKVGLQSGMRLLDVGCGWGSLSLYAAEHVGARVVGVTLSAAQQAFVQQRVDERGLAGRVEIRLQDYRDVSDGPYDAVASIEMGEHVGQDNYPAYVAQLHRLVRPGGRVLIQQMSRGDRYPGGGPFIESYIAPDMYMRPVGETVAFVERGGLEVRDVHAMREHYVRTVEAWLATFEENHEEVVSLVGEEVARVWRLYLVGGLLTFREGRMGVDQILAVRPLPDGTSGLPLVRDDAAW
ncbi:MAG TPA: cyclopropane-fatty-acyl-phospholipid synthase family protein [Mycobacteriales bacterium]